MPVLTALLCIGGYIGIMDKKMEATIVYWGFIGTMEKKIEIITLYGVMRPHVVRTHTHKCCVAGPSQVPPSSQNPANKGFQQGLAF